MKFKHISKTLAVTLAIFSSTAAMGQQDTVGVKPENPQSEQRMLRKLVPENAPDWMKDVADRIQLHGYAQGGYNYTRKGGTDTNTFELKRVLFWANAQITDRWSFLFMHDFSSVVQEFYTDFRISKNKALTVRVGQFKNGLSLENPLSPTSMEAIDVYSEGVTFLTGCGSDPLMGVQYGRDLGLSLYGETNNGKFRYELDVMNGQGINKKDGNNFKDFIARLEYRPVKGLNLVATGQVGRGHCILKDTDPLSVYNPTIAPGADYKRNRWTVGFDYKCKAFKAHGEYLEGYDGDVVSRGGYLTGSVPLGTPKVEFVGSYDYFNFNTTLGMDQHKAIAGLQYWFFKKCRIQVQYVYKSAYVANNTFIKEGNHAVMCQLQVRFN
ncbi:MAG: porin [Bacteroidaceae bacterium]|nr:porin [Bacteroidaceae bacterium]